MKDQERLHDPSTDDIEAARGLVEAIVANIEHVVVGNHEPVEHVVTTLLAGGHVLLDDVPGVGKTMLARSVAASIDGDFRRIQFTPDLLPADVTGVNVYNEATAEFEFRPGPVFGNVMLADEINRAPPKTQSALLEAMEESQVTVDGETRALPDPFLIIATQNTVEADRTYDLPVAERDRFAKQLSLGYLGADDETDLLGRVVDGHPIDELSPVVGLETLRRARETSVGISVEEPVRTYITRLARYTREHAELGVSPRGSITLLRAAQPRAILDGRDYVIPDDVQREAPAVLSHRIVGDGRDGERVVADALDSVPVP
ncbi:MAG: MoxR-like ATPase [Halovenus sp.]|jgi:MoxR-like ATPase